MEDREILDCIRALVAEEHWLRQQRDDGKLSEDVEVRRLSEVENSLDQLWDLLRRRRAMRAAGLNPDTVDERPQLQVDAYLQ
jgi:hypothetical protein